MSHAALTGLPSRHPIGEQLPALYADDAFAQRFTAGLDTVRGCTSHRYGAMRDRSNGREGRTLRNGHSAYGHRPRTAAAASTDGPVRVPGGARLFVVDQSKALSTKRPTAPIPRPIQPNNPTSAASSPASATVPARSAAERHREQDRGHRRFCPPHFLHLAMAPSVVHPPAHRRIPPAIQPGGEPCCRASPSGRAELASSSGSMTRRTAMRRAPVGRSPGSVMYLRSRAWYSSANAAAWSFVIH